MESGSNMTIDKFDRESNGSLYDRGMADKYYGRRPNPHWYPEGTYKCQPVTVLTDDEIAEYMAGYVDCCEFKDWN